MKESQVISLMYDITEIQPDLTNLSHFVYQVFYSFYRRFNPQKFIKTYHR